MIMYNQAFDLYHCVYRVLQLLNKLEENKTVELDRIRIWDFYLLFPNKIHEIRLKRDEKELRSLRRQTIKKVHNPYEEVFENRKVFEKIRPFQLSALNCIASYGIIDKEHLKLNRVEVINPERLKKYVSDMGEISTNEIEIVRLLTEHFYDMTLFGGDGLKDRTKLMECKYDA